MCLKIRYYRCNKTTRLNTFQKWSDGPDEDPPDDNGDDDDSTEYKVDARRYAADTLGAQYTPDRRENQRKSRGDNRRNDRHPNQDGKTPHHYARLGHYATNEKRRLGVHGLMRSYHGKPQFAGAWDEDV